MEKKSTSLEREKEGILWEMGENSDLKGKGGLSSDMIKYLPLLKYRWISLSILYLGLALQTLIGYKDESIKYSTR